MDLGTQLCSHALTHCWAGVHLGLTACLQLHKSHQTQLLIARAFVSLNLSPAFLSRWERQAPVGCLSPYFCSFLPFPGRPEVISCDKAGLPVTAVASFRRAGPFFT